MRRVNSLRIAGGRSPDRHGVYARDGGRGRDFGLASPGSRTCLRLDKVGSRPALSGRDALRHQLHARQSRDHRTFDPACLRAVFRARRASPCFSTCRTTPARLSLTWQSLSALHSRKGATRAFGPGHWGLPEDLRSFGQPVLIGGSMGTSSYVLTAAAGNETLSFPSACHGAGRQMS